MPAAVRGNRRRPRERSRGWMLHSMAGGGPRNSTNRVASLHRFAAAGLNVRAFFVGMGRTLVSDRPRAYGRRTCDIIEARWQSLADVRLPSGCNAGSSLNNGSARTGAVEMKSAWGILTDPSQNSRYPTTQAVLINQGGACSPATMGLVGLHSIHKTVSQP